MLWSKKGLPQDNVSRETFLPKILLLIIRETFCETSVKHQKNHGFMPF